MIRSLGQQHIMLEQFHTYQNQHSQVLICYFSVILYNILHTYIQGWYLYLVTVRWFGLRIDLLSSLFLIAVAFFSIPLASRKSYLENPKSIHCVLYYILGFPTQNML